MTWRDNLQAASFRGVPFVVETEDGNFGRRSQLHEYPQRDKPYSEDLGRKARTFSLIAFVIGDEYMARRDALLEAIEKGGPGELVHPWYGRMMVTVQDDVRVSHSNSEGGMCRFSLSFVEAGELAFPSANAATGVQALQSVDALEAIAKQDFTDSFSVNGLPDFAVQDAVTNLDVGLQSIDTALGNANVILRDPLNALRGELGTLVTTPFMLANRVFGILNKTAAVLSAASSLGNIDNLNFSRAFGALRMADMFSNASGSPATPTRRAMLANRNASQTLLRRAMLVQAAGMTAAMPLPVYEDAVTLKFKLLSALDDEAAIADDEVYRALTDTRSKLFADVNFKIRSAARLNTVTPREVTPALVLAYDIYEDVAREDEIVTRNKLRHPGFTPAIGLKVLSV